MERKIDSYLLDWQLDIKKKPLVLYGNKQVGKTYSAISFGIKAYKNMAYFNALQNEELLKLSKENKLDKVISGLSLLSGETILEGDSLIIIDNVETNDYVHMLELFAENTKYHIIFILSLRDVLRNFKTKKAIFKSMTSVDFEEYLNFTGNAQLIHYIRNAYKNNKAMPFHKMALDLFEDYLLTGGMPEVIAAKEEKEVLNNAFYSKILDVYKKEVLSKDNLISAQRGLEVLNIIPSQLFKDNKKFQYTLIKEGARSKDYDDVINNLYDNGFIYKSYKVTDAVWPLTTSKDKNSFKLYLNDTGLLKYMMHINKKKYYLNPEIAPVLIENYLASALINMGFSLYYYQSSGKAELDFLVQNRHGEIIPIELQREAKKRSKSLSQYKASFETKMAIRVGSFENAFKAGVKYVPLYAIFCLKSLEEKIHESH